MLQTTGILSKLAGITLDIEKGDTLLGGRFKNIPMVVKETGTDELGQPTVNGKKLLSFRIKKEMPEKTAMLRTTEILFKTATWYDPRTWFSNKPAEPEAPVVQDAPYQQKSPWQDPAAASQWSTYQPAAKPFANAYNAAATLTGPMAKNRQSQLVTQANQQSPGVTNKTFKNFAELQADTEGQANLAKGNAKFTPNKINYQLHGDWSKKTNPDMKHTGVFQGSKGRISYSSNMAPMNSEFNTPATSKATQNTLVKQPNIVAPKIQA